MTPRLTRLGRGFVALLRRRRVEDDLDRELRSFEQLATDAKRRDGLSPAEAARAARLETGSLAAVKDHTRDAGWDGWIAAVWQDVRYALRTLRRTPGFTAVAVVTLALGIGAGTAIFSVVNAVLLRPLPFADPDRLVVMRGSLADLRDLQDANEAFDGMAIWASNQFNLTAGGETQQVLGGQVTRNLLPLLGVQPMLGRTFSAADEQQDTVIVSYALWQARFGGDQAVLGRRLDLGGTPYTVIGVTPPWFRFPDASFQLWVPLASIDRVAPAQAKNRAFRIFTAVARLRATVTIDQARAEVTAFSGRLAREFPATNEGVVVAVGPLYDRLIGNARPVLGVLLGMVGLLLLIACANVANLLLARTTARDREMAVRAAIGANRGRLVRQLLTESVTLAAAGGALAFAVMTWGVRLLPAALESRVPRAEGIRLDATVLACSFGATLLTGLIFGLAPAWQVAGGWSRALQAHGHRVLGSARGRRLRRAIVIAETALAVVVLVGAGLLVRSFSALTAQDAGFTPDRLVSFNTQFVAVGDAAARAQAAGALIDRLNEIPGVIAGGATGLPAVTAQRATRFALDGRALTPGQDTALFIAASPRYFDALDTPVVEGRAIDARDAAAAEPVVVINRTMARQLFPEGGAIGRRIRLVNPEQSDAWRTIVGVAGDVNYRGLDQQPQPAIYTPFAQTPFMWMYVMVRTTGAAPGLAGTLRAVVPSVHPSLVAANIRAMDDVLAQTVAAPRFTMLLVASFAGVALVLTAIGIYGVIAYAVAQRRQEIGVRLALGASRGDVMRLVLRDGITTAAAGVAIGLAAAASLAGMLSTLLFGVTARDPVTFAAGAAILLGVAIVASYVPARRAMRVEPVIALRE